MDETERIAMLARVLAVTPAGASSSVVVGIGDDAAVLDPAARGAVARIVWTIDEQVEGTHFRRDLVEWHDVGWRSLMAAASDIAAMGAEPWCALCALVLPDDVDDAALERMGRGQREAAASIDAQVVGGNLARGPALSVATTWLGTCHRAVTRSGAVAGDGLWLAGRVGLAAAGLQALETGKEGDVRFATPIEAWRRPRALVAEGRSMAPVAHAAVDVSDGLARDAAHVAKASGVQLVFDEAAIIADLDLVEAAAALGASPAVLALHGGEDYALLAASPSPIEGFRRIGEVRAGHGLVLRTAHGEHELSARGYDHFAGVR